ncbi:STAS domain-containing protein [Neptunicella marina]|uniref:STAS domain-containing protein n=1 Tax=Neptunicella marina TaxID=2125989 RepID=A0A8J6IS38_9ALTE|nr:STAS domain-containing protein [Neptunicella marina]MBC3765254.1 STAS domain-containing protein [Neptunicella marina]
MNKTLSIKQQDNVFVFSGDLLAVNLANPWQHRYSEWQQAGNELQFDLAEVNNIDTAGLAWLIELSGECEKAGKKLSIINLPNSLIKLAKMSDAEDLLPLQ